VGSGGSSARGRRGPPPPAPPSPGRAIALPGKGAREGGSRAGQPARSRRKKCALGLEKGLCRVGLWFFGVGGAGRTTAYVYSLYKYLSVCVYIYIYIYKYDVYRLCTPASSQLAPTRFPQPTGTHLGPPPPQAAAVGARKNFLLSLVPPQSPPGRGSCAPAEQSPLTPSHGVNRGRRVGAAGWGGAGKRQTSPPHHQRNGLLFIFLHPLSPSGAEPWRKQ